MMPRKIARTITSKKLEDLLIPKLETLAGDVVVDLGGKRGSHLERVDARIKINLDLDGRHEPTIVGNAHSLPLRDSSVNIVLATELLEHCQDPWEVVDEVFRVLSLGGVCLLSTRFIFPIHNDPEDYFRFTDAGLRHLFRKFSDVVVTAQGGLMSSVFDLVTTKLRYLMILTPLLSRLPDAPYSRTPLGYLVEARK